MPVLQRLRPARLHLVLAAVAFAAIGACLDVVQPSEVNVVVVIADVPQAAALHVELTDQDGTVIQRDPAVAPTVNVAFANVKAGDITVTAVAYDADRRLVARARQLRAKATASRGTFQMSFRDEEPDAGGEPDAGTPDAGEAPDAGEIPDAGTPDAGSPGCVDYDEQGFACPQAFATLTKKPHALIALGTPDLPAVLAISDPATNSATLVRAGETLDLVPGVQAGAAVVAPDGLSVLLPTGDAASGYHLWLMRIAEGAPIDVGGPVPAGRFGFLHDGTAWAIEAPDDTGYGRFIVVKPGEGAPTTDPACQLRVRGPISPTSGATTRKLVFEQAAIPPVVVLDGGGSCQQSPVGEDSALPGSWSATSNATKFLYFSQANGTWMYIASGGESLIDPAPPEAPDGATLLSSDGSFVFSAPSGLYLFTPGGPGYAQVSDVPGVVDFYADQQKSYFVGRSRDGSLAVAGQGGVSAVRGTALAPAPSAGDATGKTVVLWEAATSSPGVAGVWVVSPPNAPARIGDGPVGGARLWSLATGDVLVASLNSGLSDASTGQQLVSTASNPAFDITPSGLVFIDPMNRARLMPSPGGTVVGLTSDAASAVAGVRGDGTTYWVARAVGDLVRVAAPKGVTP